MTTDPMLHDRLQKGLSAEQLSWSPDSARLAIVVPSADGAAGNDVSILDLTTGDVTSVRGPSGYWWNWIEWSPDGTQLALAGK